MQPFCLEFSKDGSVMLPTLDHRLALHAALEHDGCIASNHEKILDTSIRLFGELGSLDGEYKGCVRGHMAGKEYICIEHGPHKPAPFPCAEATAAYFDCGISALVALVETFCGTNTAARLGTLLLEQGQGRLFINERKTGEGAARCLSYTEHVDRGLLTLVFGTRAALEVNGDCVRRYVEHAPCEIVVMPGYLLEQMTGGRIKATRYRHVYKDEPMSSIVYMLELQSETQVDTSFGAKEPFCVADVYKQLVDVHEILPDLGSPATPAAAGPSAACSTATGGKRTGEGPPLETATKRIKREEE